MCGMVEDTKRYCRTQIRDILTKLVRKYGYNLISTLIPQSDVFMVNKLKNIKKREKTSLNKKLQDQGSSDEEEEDKNNNNLGEE